MTVKEEHVQLIKYVNVKVRNTGIEKADEDKEKKTKATKREKND